MDEAAKAAAGSKMAIMAPVVTIQPQVTLDNVAAMQERAPPPNEKNLWGECGAMTDAQSLWQSHDGLLVIPVTLVSVLVTNAHGLDHCVSGEVLEKIKHQGFWSPYLQAHVDCALGECEVCVQYNIRKEISTLLGQVPLPKGRFKLLAIDYVDMVHPVRGQRNLLVIADRFTRWVKAVPVRAQNVPNIL